MNKTEFTGKTLDEALGEAARTLGVERSALGYNVVNQGKGGILSKLFSRTVRIEAWAESTDSVQDAAREAVRAIMDKRQEVPRQEKPLQRRTPADKRERPARAKSEEKSPEEATARRSGFPPRETIPLENDAVQAVLKDFEQTFLRTFDVSQENCQRSQDSEGNIKLTIDDAYIEELLARSDRLSLAFEHIFKRLAQKKVGDVSGRVYLSAGRSDEIRQQTLKDFAHSVAEKVKKTGKAITISSKTSQERRIIHMSIDGMQGVATRSVGAGDKRRLIIYSTEAKQRREKQRAATPTEKTDNRRPQKRRGRGGRPQREQPKIDSESTLTASCKPKSETVTP